jgi:hypothetical protein
MTAPASHSVEAVEERRRFTVRFVETSLRRASMHLRGDASIADVHAAERAIDEAERSLGLLTIDPWEPALSPLREAREILSSHLLAAAACTGADVAPAITARVLREGADSARRALTTRGSTAEVDSHGH